MWKLTIKLFLPFIVILGISITSWSIHDAIENKRIYDAWQEIHIAELEKQVEELTSTDGYVVPDSGNLTFPFYSNSEIRVSSQFGTRTDPFDFESGPVTEEKTHKGIDLVSEKQDTVLATASGRIIEHWPAPNGYWKGDPLYGGKIVILDSNGFQHLFGHMSETYVNTGDYIEAGDEIGRMGNTGITTGPHLHYEIRMQIGPKEYIWYDPLQHFDIKINEDDYIMFPEDEVETLTITGRI